MAAPGANSNIQIAINVVDAGSSATIGKVRTEIVGLDTEAKSLAASWGLAGTQIEQTNQKLRQTTGAAGAASAGLNGVKKNAALARYEFSQMGLHVPKYLASVAASSQALMGVMASMSTMFIGIGMISIFGMAVKGAKDFYNSSLNVNAGLEKYNAEITKGRDQDFGNVHSIETTLARLREVNGEAEKYNASANKQLQGDAVDLDNIFKSKKNRDKEQDKRRQADELTQRVQEEMHRQRVATIEAGHAGDASLRGQQKITAELNKQLDINKENRDWAQKQDASHGNLVGVNAGATEQQTADKSARAKASADQIELGRRERDEMVKARNEAMNAGLRGEALYRAQEEQGIAAIVQKFKDGEISKRAELGLTKAAQDKYQEEARKRLQDQQDETAKLQAQAGSAGMTGAAKIRAGGNDRENELLRSVQNGTLDPSQYSARYTAIEKETNAEILKDKKEFFDHVDELAASSADHQLSGFARIRAEAQKELASLKRTFEGHAGKPGDRDYADYLTMYQRGVNAVNGSAGTQTAELARHNADETQKLEDDARRKSLTGEAQKTQQIVDEFNERVRKYGEMLSKQEISEQDYNRRILAADREKNAELQQQAMETRDNLAGELDGLFKNPSKWMQGIGEKAMSTAAASMLMQIPGMENIAGHKGGITGSIADGSFLHAGTQGSGFRLPGLFGTQRQQQTAAMAPELTHLSGTSGAMTLGSAQISIGSASINVAGGSVAGGTGSGTALGTSVPGYSSADVAGVGGGSAAAMGSFASSTRGGAGMSLGSGLGTAQRSAALLKESGVKLPSFSSSSSTFAAVNTDDYSSSNSTKLPNSAPGDSGLPGSYSPDLAGAASGGIGLYGAFMGTGGAGGAIGGALSGAEMGLAFGGPIGAAVGAVGGAILGMFGFGGRMQAEKYWHYQGKPHLDATAQAFNTGQEDYLTAYADLQSLSIEARSTTDKMGSGAHDYFNDTIQKAINDEEKTMTREARAGRSQITMSTAQFHTGGWVSGFGDMGTGGKEGFIHAMQNEYILHPQAAATNAPLLPAMNAGLDLPRLLQGPTQMPVQQKADVNVNVHAIDKRGVHQFLDEYKHELRASLNDTYGEYSGGSDLV